ncbi:hypothetical protein GTY51_01210 [Streptomyces sp. SID4936]|nr:hypothetical protein [Streptomyces sp. SID4936]
MDLVVVQQAGLDQRTPEPGAVDVAIEAHRAFISRRRTQRPSEEYRTVTEPFPTSR